MITFGPIRITKSSNKSYTSFGPIIVSDDVEVKSVRSFGPAIFHGNVKAESIITNGPLTSTGNIIADSIVVNGPLEGENINAGNLKINGPVEAENITAEYIRINGPVDVMGVLEARDTIVIHLGTGHPHLSAGVIKAPRVIIKRTSFLSTLKNAMHLLGIKVKQRKPIQLDMRIEAEILYLDGVDISKQISDGEKRYLLE